MVRTDWLVASVGVLIVVALAYSFLAPNVGRTIPAMTTENSFVVVAPWSSAPVVVQQACRPPPVGTIPVGDGVILVDQKGGQHFDFSGLQEVDALDKTALGFDAILDVDVVSTSGDESVVVLEGPVPTPQQYESNTYAVAPDGTPTLVVSQPTTPEQIQQVPPQIIPSSFNPATNEVTVVNSDGSVTTIPLSPLGFQDIANTQVLQNPDGTLSVVVSGQAGQQFVSNTYAVQPDASLTLVSSLPTTEENVAASPIPVPSYVTPAGDQVIATTPDGTTTAIPLEPLGFQSVLDANVVQNPDGSFVVTVDGAVQPPQQYEARTYTIAADGTPTLVSSASTTYDVIQQGIALEPQQVVADPATNTVYTYDSSQDAVAMLDVDTGQVSMTAVTDLPSLLGQSPEAFQAALQNDLRVQDQVQYTATRIDSSMDVQIVGVVPPMQQVRFDIYTSADQVDPSQLGSPVRTVVIPNPSSFAYPYQIVVSNVAPVDRYTYVQPRLEPAQVQQTAVQWQQTQTLSLTAVQQDPTAALLQYAAETTVARPLSDTLANTVYQQSLTSQSVISPNDAIAAANPNVVSVDQSAGVLSTTAPNTAVTSQPTTVQEAANQCTGPDAVCANAAQ